MFVAADTNIYSYVRSDPLDRIDPDGRFAFGWGADPSQLLGAYAVLANVLTPGASTSFRWNGGDPIVVLENTWLNFGNRGFTFGHVVAFRNDWDTYEGNYEHELAHVKQHDVMMMTYLPTHAATKAFCYAFSSDPIACDPLETKLQPVRAMSMAATMKDMLICGCAALSCLIALGCDPPVDLEGGVVDEHGRPVAGVEISLECPQRTPPIGGRNGIRTGPDGQFRASGVGCVPKVCDVRADFPDAGASLRASVAEHCEWSHWYCKEAQCNRVRVEFKGE